MSTEPQRTCPSCGNELSGAMEFCPVCMLRKALVGGLESGEALASEGTVKPIPGQVVQRFEHYELMTGEDGTSVELGRGAMGVTYKAVHVDLHCPLTLKVIREQGAHARKVMESYQTWFGEGPELSVLRILGLFDRPVDEKVLGALLKPPAIQGLTESLTDLSPIEWQTILARLRRARLLAGEDPLGILPK